MKRWLVVSLMSMTLLACCTWLIGCAESLEARQQRLLMTFNTQMLMAIENHSGTPMRRHGRGMVKVGFDYVDRRAKNCQVVESSGDPVLDDAALADVRSTVLPPRPSQLDGVQHFVVGIRFY